MGNTPKKGGNGTVGSDGQPHLRPSKEDVDGLPEQLNNHLFSNEALSMDRQLKRSKATQIPGTTASKVILSDTEKKIQESFTTQWQTTVDKKTLGYAQNILERDKEKAQKTTNPATTLPAETVSLVRRFIGTFFPSQKQRAQLITNSFEATSKRSEKLHESVTSYEEKQTERLTGKEAKAHAEQEHDKYRARLAEVSEPIQNPDIKHTSFTKKDGTKLDIIQEIIIGAPAKPTPGQRAQRLWRSFSEGDMAAKLVSNIGSMAKAAVPVVKNAWSGIKTALREGASEEIKQVLPHLREDSAKPATRKRSNSEPIVKRSNTAPNLAERPSSPAPQRPTPEQREPYKNKPLPLPPAQKPNSLAGNNVLPPQAPEQKTADTAVSPSPKKAESAKGDNTYRSNLVIRTQSDRKLYGVKEAAKYFEERVKLAKPDPTNHRPRNR